MSEKSKREAVKAIETDNSTQKDISISEKAPQSEPKKAKEPLKVGDRVKMKAGAKIYGQDLEFSPWVYKAELYVKEIHGLKVIVASTMASGVITGAVDKADLTRC